MSGLSEANADLEVAVFTSVFTRLLSRKTLAVSVEEALKDDSGPWWLKQEDKGIPFRGCLSCIVDCP
nr:hypothetical protein [Vibrio neptunius]